ERRADRGPVDRARRLRRRERARRRRRAARGARRRARARAAWSPMSEAESTPPPSELARWRVPLVLLALTLLSTMWVGAGMELDEDVQLAGYGDMLAYFVARPSAFLAGWTFAVPLMGILFAHEMGHYVAAKIHRVDVSPPYFIPVPFFLLGTMGAVIRMRGKIETRNALLDIGAAGPLAGMVVAIPVLV